MHGGHGPVPGFGTAVSLAVGLILLYLSLRPHLQACRKDVEHDGKMRGDEQPEDDEPTEEERRAAEQKAAAVAARAAASASAALLCPRVRQPYKQGCVRTQRKPCQLS